MYFVSHGGEAFPILIVVLQGDGVRVDLTGSTFISKAGITSSTFKTVPDVPVNTFEIYLPEGKYSALAANGNLCTSKLMMPTAFVAQNGAEIHQNTKIAVTRLPRTQRKRRRSPGNLGKRAKARKNNAEDTTPAHPQPPIHGHNDRDHDARRRDGRAGRDGSVKEILFSRIGWEVNQTTGGNICTTASKNTCRPATPGSQPGRLRILQKSVAVDSDARRLNYGDVYVVDRGNNRVQEFTASGEFVSMFGEEVDQKGGDACTKAEENECQAGKDAEAPGQFDGRLSRQSRSTGNMRREHVGRKR